MQLIRSIIAIGICLTSAAHSMEVLTLEDFTPTALPGSAFEFEEDPGSAPPLGKWKASFSATTVTISDFPGFPGTFTSGWTEGERDSEDSYTYNLAASPAFGGKAVTLRLWISVPGPRFLVWLDGESSYGGVKRAVAERSPAMTIEVGGKSLTNGKSTIKLPPAKAGKSGSTKRITIKNTGTGDLNITDIKKRGTNRADFIISKPNRTKILAGKSATFTITFKPKAKSKLSDTRTASISIVSNDENSPFTIKLSASVR